MLSPTKTALEESRGSHRGVEARQEHWCICDELSVAQFPGMLKNVAVSVPTTEREGQDVCECTYVCE